MRDHHKLQGWTKPHKKTSQDHQAQRFIGHLQPAIVLIKGVGDDSVASQMQKQTLCDSVCLGKKPRTI